MPTRTITEFLDAAMRRAKTNSRQIERETGVPSGWIRALKAGDIKGDPDPDRMSALARHLNVEEIELWKLLNRYDRVAVLRGETPPGMEEQAPAWALDLMRRLDEISRRLDLLGAAAEGVAEGERRARAGEVAQQSAGSPAPSAVRRPRGTRRGSPG